LRRSIAVVDSIAAAAQFNLSPKIKASGASPETQISAFCQQIADFLQQDFLSWRARGRRRRRRFLQPIDCPNGHKQHEGNDYKVENRL
jgi:hypothetical protein